MTTAFSEAINDLYAVSSQYPLRPVIHTCDHCFSPEEHQALQERLRSKPLRQLTPEDLEPFAFEAVSIIGIVEDLKHFLPRMLELVPTKHQDWGLQPGILLSKLKHTQWQTWPNHERQALETYLEALWQKVLSEFEDYSTIDEYLNGLVQVAPRLAPYFDIWLRNNAISVIRHLAHFIELQCPGLIRCE